MDKNGYPDDNELEFIENYNCIIKPIKPLISFIKERWKFKDFFGISERTEEFEVYDVSTKNKFRPTYKVLEVSTGGWSGNESIITALRENKYFWAFFWVESRRGGHYIFEVPLSKWK